MINKSILLFLFLGLFTAPNLNAAVTYDTSASGNCGVSGGTACTAGGTTLTYPITIGSGSNRALVVFVAFSSVSYYDICPRLNNNDSLMPLLGVTHAGVNLKLQSVKINNDCTLGFSLWSLPEGTQPTSGTNDIVVTVRNVASDSIIHSGAVAASGVDQSNPFTSIAFKGEFQDTSKVAQLQLPESGASDLVVSFVCNGTSVGSTPQTQRWVRNVDNMSICNNSGGATAAGGTKYLSWNVGADFWAIYGLSLRAAGGPTSTAVKFDASGNGRCGEVANGGDACASNTTLTYSLTVGSDSNRALAVFTFVANSGTGLTAATVTYNGVSLTKITSLMQSGNETEIALWSLPAGTQPASGTHNVVVTASSSLGGYESIHSGAIAASGVNQTTTFSSYVVNRGVSTSATAKLSASGINDLVVISVCQGYGVDINPHLQKWYMNSSGGNTCDNSAGGVDRGGTTQISWRGGGFSPRLSDFWLLGAASFKAIPLTTKAQKLSNKLRIKTSGNKIQVK